MKPIAHRFSPLRNPAVSLETTIVVFLVVAALFYGGQLLDLISSDVRSWVTGWGRP